jgi:ribosome-associated translation inhibitor RaiA
MDTLESSFAFRDEASLPERVEAEMYTEAEGRLRALMEGHTDIVDASVAVEELTGDTTPHLYEVRVVVYIRPEDIVAVEKHETAQGALKGALDAIERQVRERRAKLREIWKRP